MSPSVVLVVPHVAGIVQHRDTLPSYHLGVATLSAVLENQGVRVTLIDGRGLGLSPRQIVDRIVRERPILVGFTAMTHEIGRAAELATLLKEEEPSVVTVIGGAHATALPCHTLEQFHGFEIACQGEGERTIVELVHAVSNRQGLDTVAGIVRRVHDTHGAGVGSASSPDGSEIVRNPSREPITDLDSLPLPAWHLFPRSPHYPILSGRGCPYRCVFCARSLGSTYRPRSPASVIAEIEAVHRRFNACSFSFEDETFTVDRDRTSTLLDLLIESGLSRIPWMANVHPRHLDSDLSRHLRAAGCVSIGMGLESGNPDILAKTGKGISVEDARRAVSTAQEAGLKVRAFFILGHPCETLGSALDTIRFAASLNPEQASFGIMVPYPGTAVAQMAERRENGLRILSKDWASHDKFLGGSLELDTLPRPALEILQIVAYTVLYLTHLRLDDFARFVAKHWRAGLALGKKVAKDVVGRILRSIFNPIPTGADQR